MQNLLKIRTRVYRAWMLKHDHHEAVLNWKKGKLKTFPEPVYMQAVEVINRYLQGFDVVTVPAPSFHDYGSYPAETLARQLAADCGFELSILFPYKTNKTRMGWHSSLQKTIQRIAVESGKFVLVLDDILTTGHTARVTMQAILDCGSFPCFLAMTEHK